MSFTQEHIQEEKINLWAGNVFPVVATKATIVANAGEIKIGTCLGMITESGKLTIVDSTATDGSGLIYAVASENLATSATDIETVVYLTGEFNQDALTFGGNDTYATHKNDARKIGLFFKPIDL